MTTKQEPIDELGKGYNIVATPGPAFPCPVCKQEIDHYRNIGKDSYGVCKRCGVYFYLGYKLFSTWHIEPPEVWEENKEYLSQFRQCNPL